MSWEKRQKFSIRKFSIGAASVMIGQFYLGTVTNSPTVKADERTQTQIVEGANGDEKHHALAPVLNEISEVSTEEKENSVTTDKLSTSVVETETKNQEEFKTSPEINREGNTPAISEDTTEHSSEEEKNSEKENNTSEVLTHLAKEVEAKLPTESKVEKNQVEANEPEGSETKESSIKESSPKEESIAKETAVHYQVIYQDLDTNIL